MNLLVALAFYASTVFGFTNHLLILSVIPLFFQRNTALKFSESDFKFIFFLLFIVIFSLVNNIIGFFILDDLSFPFFVFTVFSFLFYKLINEKVLFYLLLFILVEIFCALIQYNLGVSSFFSSSEKYFEFSNDALYFKKSAGLSASSSVLAYKVLIAFFIVDFLFKDRKIKFFLYVALIVGLYVTFNRTSIVAAISFFIIAHRAYLKALFFNRRGVYLLPLFLVLVLFLTPSAYSVFINEFSRGNADAGVDLSYRTLVWGHYIDFISNNLMLGNFSYKYISELNVAGYGQHNFHAHNSILMIFSSHGVLISILFLFLLASKINNNNLKYIIPIFIYSFAQYGVFWGLSFLDILLAFFLMTNSRITLNRND
ncbi:hypothetical protein H5232_17745 [Pseudoalteromonas sp. SG41-5]|uniref:O-antigen ligase family protein n=1 Tax=Pseudoalteromonas sp. SG41-5 TaxID=2760975 RepID=UPI0016038ABB|nr:O-antigen ligase family protein [Pseudoalteromonas sp. SG41-5]MBB1470273.1 hypothetical protein [Pseudoalteromonas sp. SG41-5]